MNELLLQALHPAQVEVEVCHSEELDRRRGLTSELDEMWSFVRSKANPRWLWHAIDHHTGKVLAYVFGRRQDDVFLKLQELLAPFGIMKEDVSQVLIPDQRGRPNSYRLMKSPITRSCMCSVLEKHSVRRTRRLIRVRRLMCLLSIFWVFSLPT